MRRRRLFIPACLVATAMTVAGVARVGRAEEAAQAPRSRPLLQQLNAEFQSLYQEVGGGVVRVQFPTPRWAQAEADKGNPVRDERWREQLAPEVKAALQRQIDDAKRGEVRAFTTVIVPGAATTRPAGPQGAAPAPDGTITFEPGATGQMITIHAGGERTAGGDITPAATRPTMRIVAATEFAPNEVGLLLDEAGHFLVPKFVEKEAIGAGGLRVAAGGEETVADFVGSDRQTELTILKLRKVPGRAGAVRLSDAPPPEGSLVMLISPHTGTARAVVWTGNVQDFGIVAQIDGSVAGFVRFGQFFSARAAAPVTRQLIAAGGVRRATLGIRIAALRPEDPVRRQSVLVGNRPAVRVDEVEPQSLAARAGLRPGDLVFRIGSEDVGDPPTFAAFLSAQSGRTALQVLRGRDAIIVTLDLPTAQTTHQ